MPGSPPPRPTRRRRALVALVALSLGAGVAACGSDGSGSAGPGGSGSDTGSGDGSSSSAATDAEAFPVEIEHTYGTTTIDERPERVVVVGLTEQDAFIALGVKPVATTEWFGDHEGAIWPWAQDEAAELDGDIEVLSDVDGLQTELIKAQRPDVIVGLYSGMTEEEYDALSDIAPTVAQPGDVADFAISWQDETRTVGRILGESERADELVADVEGQLSAARTAHPEFEGKEAIVATTFEGIYVYGRDDPRGRFVEALGLTVPEEVDAIVGEDFGGNLSLERADLLDVDVLIWVDPEDAEGELGGPLYDQLAVHTEGREVNVDSEAEEPLGGATSFVSVLSLPYLVENIVPMIATAIDGDPDTEVKAP